MTSSSRNEEQLGGELTSAKHQLLEVREQLEMAEQELERKFSQTGAYQNMKKMLAQKNNQIKEMRRKMSKYERNLMNEAGLISWRAIPPQPDVPARPPPARPSHTAKQWGNNTYPNAHGYV